MEEIVSSGSGEVEEGEIVDDDFEDISDNSIIDSTFGKFVSTNEHLRALSLSSISDSGKIKRKRKLLHRKCRHHRKRKKVELPVFGQDSDSSDNELAIHQDLKYKLKEAIHIGGVEGTRNNLQTRLKAMTNLGKEVVEDKKSPEKTPEESPVINSVPEPVEDKIEDNELENLRIEALKTAVLNKFQRRKRKKALEEEKKKESEKPVENKENNTPKEDKNPEIQPEIDIEEDEDLLRASLLANFAKKITSKPSSFNFQHLEAKPVPPKLPIQTTVVSKKTHLIKNNNNITKTKILTKKTVQTVSKPQVKPLIIQVNGDSDSEEEPLKPPVPDLNVISNNVEKFLKEQRAKFEEKRKVSQLVTRKTNNTSSILEKSAVKLLPKSQQIEYQQLLKKLKLKNAEKKLKVNQIKAQKIIAPLKNEQKMLQKMTPVRAPIKVVGVPQLKKIAPVPGKVTVIGGANNNAQQPPKVLQNAAQTRLETKTVLPKPKMVDACVSTCDLLKSKEIISKEVASKEIIKEIVKKKKLDVGLEIELKLEEIELEKKQSGVIEELTVLQTILKEIRMQKNGSLQMKTKYQSLTPIIKQITQTSNERKNHGRRIKLLLQKLNDARTDLNNSHRKFSTLVKQLKGKKEQIDNSCKPSNERVVVTSTPARNRPPSLQEMTISTITTSSLDLEGTSSAPSVNSSAVNATSVPSFDSTSTVMNTSTNHDCEDMDVCNSDDTDIMSHVDIVDPNDIDQIFKRNVTVKCALPEYISPLNYDRVGNVDPLGIMCPFEVNGSCRDLECSFNHYLKPDQRQ